MHSRGLVALKPSSYSNHLRSLQRLPLSITPLRHHSSSSASNASLAEHSAFLPRARLNYRAIAENVSSTTTNAALRKSNLPPDAVEKVSHLYHQSTLLNRELSDLRARRSTVGAEVRRASALGESAKLKALADAKNLKEKIHMLEEQVTAVDNELYDLAFSIPNSTHPLVPIGPESEAHELDMHTGTTGVTPGTADPRRDHVRIGVELGLLDLEAASTVSGSSFYYLTNEGALLELALINYAIKKAVNHGFKPVLTPDIVRSDVAKRCGFIPRDGEASQNYRVETDHHHNTGLVLAGTAEIPLAGLFARKTFNEKDLPQLVVGLGRAFRAEAGARGADTRGLYRVHQFSKVELFAVTSAADGVSDGMMDKLVLVQRDILDGLGLTYRVLEMPSEELGASAHRKQDIEAWMPGRGRWGEVSSTSNCTDYQSRRLLVQYSPTVSASSSKNAFVHTLNGTAAAIPRLMVALIENGVVFDGEQITGIILPKVLEPFWLGPTDSDSTITFA